MMVM
ncbi:hypothetical protein Taro_009712 [Colocasia esculenta]